MLSAALEGLTLGALGLEYHGPATGYAALVALVLFTVALLLLPGDNGGWHLVAGSVPERLTGRRGDVHELPASREHRARITDGRSDE